MARSIFRATVRARTAAQKFRAADPKLDLFLREEFEGNMDEQAVGIFRSFAPELTGRLRGGIDAQPYHGGRIGFEVTASAVSERGFDYVQVTRKGHRKAIIRPKTASRIEFDSGYGFGRVIARQVRGSKPASDWAEDAAEASGGLVDEHAHSLARKISTRLL